jgi:hypothetical protein
MLLDLLIKRTSRNAETLGCLFNPTFLLLQYSLDVLFFELYESETRVEKRCANLCMTIEVKIV